MSQQIKLKVNGEGKIVIPPELCDWKLLRTSWTSRRRSKPDKLGIYSETVWMRHAVRGDKPFVKDGTIEIDKVSYEVENHE